MRKLTSWKRPALDATTPAASMKVESIWQGLTCLGTRVEQHAPQRHHAAGVSIKAAMLPIGLEETDGGGGRHQNATQYQTCRRVRATPLFDELTPRLSLIAPGAPDNHDDRQGYGIMLGRQSVSGTNGVRDPFYAPNLSLIAKVSLITTSSKVPDGIESGLLSSAMATMLPVARHIRLNSESPSSGNELTWPSLALARDSMKTTASNKALKRGTLANARIDINGGERTLRMVAD
ncbi:hypothetical protein ACRALDRAFT_1091644 [Sodiomyces alcalophilus JCM 7366]|uniref:uncharacterized protein n=1 Tax=Sodiomyces alcalophilus JCM 7366 TaxID=591952 RepID=UPI0039B462EA